MDPAVLDPHRTAASRQHLPTLAFDRLQATGRATTGARRLCASFGPRMDTRTKWVIAALLVLVLAFLVIGGIIAIASPPDSCC
jgi:hypothetical protein